MNFDPGDMNQRLKLSSGSTLINLATSGHPDWSMVTGGFYWFVGDSDTGKTVLTMGALAEASINPAFDKYELIFDNGEDGALMPVEEFFGPMLVERLKAPRYDGKTPVFSRTAEEFYFHLDDHVQAAKAKKGRPFIYLLDSMDKLGTDYAKEKFESHKEAWEKGKDAAGDYGDGKAKLNSTHLRDVCADLRDTDSILIILSQTRDNPAAKAFQSKKTVAGGRSLKFYAHWQLWSSKIGEETKSVNGTDRQVGIRSKIDIVKNRIGGKQWTVEVPIYWSVGLDDVGSCVDFLVDEKRFSLDGGKITAPDFNFEGRRLALIEKIETEDLFFELRCIVTEVWKEIERKCRVQRVNKYKKAADARTNTETK